VSRVVRDAADVNQTTRERVQQAIQELGYRASPIARALVRGQTRTLGLLVSDITNAFYPQLARAVERQAALDDYLVAICGTDDSRQLTQRQVQRLLDQGVDGFIHASTVGDEEQVLAIVGNPDRVLFANRRPARPGCHYVVSDNVLAARLLTRHLMDLGHRRIGFIAGPGYATNSTERVRGFQETLRAMPETTGLVAPGDFSPESGSRGVADWLDSADPPTAIIAVNDSVAVGVLEELDRRGVRVPADIAVAGFDDALATLSGLIGLTTVSQEVNTMGRRAVEILVSLLRHESAGLPQQEVLAPRLVVRRTTAGAAPPSAPAMGVHRGASPNSVIDHDSPRRNP
jgi:LacI family transcriptional regulator